MNIVSLAVSKDGFIARKNGDTAFLHEEANGDPKAIWGFMEKFSASIDIVVMGRKSYEVIQGFGGLPYTGKKTIVLTSQDIKVTTEDTITFNGSIEDLNSKHLRKQTVWIFGGADVIAQFKKAKLVEEYVITYSPVAIGEGIPLFDTFDDMELIVERSYGKFINRTYKNR